MISGKKSFRTGLLIVLLLTFSGAATAQNNGDSESLTLWGTDESKWPNNTDFNTPFGVAIDNSGNVYVADTDNHQIQKFTSNGTFVTKWQTIGPIGSGIGELHSLPYGVAVDDTGTVYVVDSYYNCITKFTSDGTFIAKWGKRGSGNGQFNAPSAVAVDGSGIVYVADTGNHRIQTFTTDGTYLSEWGAEWFGEGKLDSPSGVAVDNAGYIYVTDTGDELIKKFTSDGTFVTKWRAIGSGIGELSGLPYGVAVDDTGIVYVTGMYYGRIQLFTSNGTFLTQWGQNGSEPEEFCTPLGIAVDRSGAIYVADTNNNRIQMFKRSDILPYSSGNSPQSTSSPGSFIPIILGIILAALSVGIILPSRWK